MWCFALCAKHNQTGETGRIFHDGAMSMRPLNSVFLITALIVIAVSYAVFISFSEHREYSSGSLDHFLLTPAGLSKLSKECKDNPTFVYSSADGPKPTIVTLNCTIPMNKLEEQIRADGFNYINGLYQKESAQIQIINNPADKAVTSVVYIGNS